MSGYTLYTIRGSNAVKNALSQKFRNDNKIEPEGTRPSLKTSTTTSKIINSLKGVSSRPSTSPKSIAKSGGATTKGHASLPSAADTDNVAVRTTTFSVNQQQAPNPMLSLRDKVRRTSKRLTFSSFLILMKVVVTGLWGTALFSQSADSFGALVSANLWLGTAFALVGILVLHDLASS
jgi:hypothetical protein